MRNKCCWFIVCATLGGCMMGPDYRKTEPNVPERWQAEATQTATIKRVSEVALDEWWKSFDDASLDNLMQLALAENLDVKIAAARIAQARAERRSNRAELFPSVNGVAGAQRQYNPFPGLAPGIRYNLFEIGFDALWEVDLFGRQRRRLEAATAELEAAGEQYRQAKVVLSAELARSYIEYRNLQNLLRITRSNLDSQRQTLALTEKLFREGVGTRHDVVRARAQTESTEARLPSLEASLTATLRQLETLTGQQPGTLAATLNQPAPVPLAQGRQMLGSPAETIRNRPDLRAAERRLAAATAMQGAAIAELFPKISLSAFIGLRNTDIENLFKSAAFSYGTAANLLQPLLNFGRIQAGIDMAEARQKEAYLAYEKGLLEALQETETALTRYLKEEIRRQTLARAVADQQESLRLAQLRYREGVSSFLDVLDAQRAVYTEESALAESQAAAAVHLIAVYKALGGGADAQPA
jgi:NodT family efflux transporter outer membrane factor (OMF) lipoprotein